MVLHRDRQSFNNLETRLGLSFQDQGLLRQALVHRSYLNEPGGAALGSYERMEFLGDAVLELVVSNELYRNLPREDEGRLTKSRAALVCRESLARAAHRLGLEDYIAMGRGERSNGGTQRDSILEDVFEATVAAIYLDQGYDAARLFVLKALEPELTACYQGTQAPENPKSLFQEIAQGWGWPTPRYRVMSVEGPGHEPLFTIAVTVDEDIIAQGTGTRKADAERAAAEAALSRYGSIPQLLESIAAAPAAASPAAENQTEENP